MKLKSTKTSVHKTETYSVDNSDLKVIKHYVDNKIVSVDLSGKGPHNSSPVIVKPSFKDFIKTTNPFHTGWAKHCENISKKIDIDKAIKDGLVYYFYYAGHVLFDNTGKAVPIPMTFDYIGTDFHSNAVEIEKAKEVLIKHPWVLNKEDLEIQRVPYYNADGNNHRYLQVTLLPDAKSYNKMYEMAISTKRGKEFFSVELKNLVIGKNYAFPDYNPLKLHKLRIKEKQDA